MAKNNRKAIEGLKTALQTELNGINFYRMASETTADPKGKEVFASLASDEAKHFNELKKNYDSLLKTGGWSYIRMEITTVFDGDSPIFSTEFKSKIQDRHFEMSALSIGALLETNSIEFYRRMETETDDPAARNLFGQLIRWESLHLDAITKQLDLLKEEYWAQANFTPLY